MGEHRGQPAHASRIVVDNAPAEKADPSEHCATSDQLVSAEKEAVIHTTPEEASTATPAVTPRPKGPYNRPQMLSECFQPTHNSIGFLRWLMAFMVIFSHAGPIAGLWGGKDLGADFSNGQQSLGGVAVAGFFFFSGFLITRSRMGRSTIWRYMWRRFLRIFPAFFVALLLTVFILAPIAWMSLGHSFSSYFSVRGPESPWTYVLNNMDLSLRQRPIAGMGDTLPLYHELGARDWNGSAWTLRYEFICYILVALVGLIGALSVRAAGGIIVFGILVLNFLQWTYGLAAFNNFGLFNDVFLLMFFAPFAVGMFVQLFADRIPIDDRLALGSGAIALGTYATWGWNIIGVVFFGYFLMWLAVRLPLTNWEKYGDFSYGVYIFAWPVMTFLTFFGVHRHQLLYLLIVIVTVHILAYLSWHLIEKPAMSLKSWTPKWMRWLLARSKPTYERVCQMLIDPRYSSTRWAYQRVYHPSADQTRATVLEARRTGGSLRPVHLDTPKNGRALWVIARYLPLALLTVVVIAVTVMGILVRHGVL
ncbi:acyltransferase family protein [Trueperella sp. LYQ143]|uniref:acyltransferase family protein n=1 Tax=Trueperella sp. LYQ143 TaxID=3391059 RepID=UPI003983B585